jgi:hypothetical protein
MAEFGHDQSEVVMNISKDDLENLLKKAKANFRFEYVGGGYFRDKRVAKGIKADTLHGSEILDEFCSELIKRLSENQSDF